MQTEFIQVDSWVDHDTGNPNGDGWPYPTRYIKTQVIGELADAVRAKLEVEGPAPVMLTEKVVSGGYSEWTQETDYYYTLEVDGREVDLGLGLYSWENGLGLLLKFVEDDDDA